MAHNMKEKIGDVRASKRMCGSDETLRRVVAQRMDYETGDFIIHLECGHEAHRPSRRGAIKYETAWCIRCNQN
jgi:hypothetical protein